MGRTLRTHAPALALAVGLGGCELGGEQTPCARYEQTPRTSFVVLPDTQYYACAYSPIFEAQTRYVAANATSRGLALALHTGDIVDRDVQSEWRVAAHALHHLDGHLPYLLTTGNHDLDLTRGSLLESYFDARDLTLEGCVQHAFRTDGKLDDAYALVTLRGERWLFVGLEFGPRDASLAWADAVLDAFPDTPAVLFTHAYLYADDERYDRAVVPMQPFHPDTYGVTASEGIADGQDLYEALVEPHPNVRLVLSGHVIPDGTARSRVVRPDGSVVHEVLTNFQTCGACPCEAALGGGGYLRVFELTEARDGFRVSTYSPYLDVALEDAENTFELRW